MALGAGAGGVGGGSPSIPGSAQPCTEDRILFSYLLSSWRTLPGVMAHPASTALDPEKQDRTVGRGKALESVTPGLRAL